MSIRAVAVIVFALGAALRVAGAGRPIDRAENLWREADIAAVARSFDREGMSILYPRVDWRGDGPGYAEMEFPIYPWTIAWLHRCLGLDEAAAGRRLAVGFSLGAMAAFFAIAFWCLSAVGALGAALFFALDPLAVEVSHLILADGLMFLFYVTAVYAFLRWLEDERWRWWALAAGATAGAVLTKAPALHLGLLFALLVVRRHGLGAVAMPRLWAFAVVSVAGAALWYHHAYGLWTAYGNSLGVSNEYHWIGLDMLARPRFLLGLGKLELLHVWTPPAVVVVVLGLVRSPSRDAVRLAASWLACVGVYYLVAARTTSGIWGVYYHVVSVPGVALLVGAGAEVACAPWASRRG